MAMGPRIADAFEHKGAARKMPSRLPCGFEGRPANKVLTGFRLDGDDLSPIAHLKSINTLDNFFAHARSRDGLHASIMPPMTGDRK